MAGSRKKNELEKTFNEEKHRLKYTVSLIDGLHVGKFVEHLQKHLLKTSKQPNEY